MRALQLRGGHTELVHPFSFATATADGPVRSQHWGEPCATFWRSAGKPFQLRTALTAIGGAEPFSDIELAIGASSHSGQPAHTDQVRELLARFGHEVAALQCGVAVPAHKATAESLIRENRPFCSLHSDCSGKHSFMLGACGAQGWDPNNYLSPDHPLQVQILADIVEVCGERPPIAVDGCGVPTFYLSLEGMARAWARLALTMADPTEDPLLARIGWAMENHPWWTSGDGRIDLAVARRAQRPLVGKIGALGVFCVAIPEARLGIAIKVHSGDENALVNIIPAVIERVFPGMMGPDVDWPWAGVTNGVGKVVGQRLVEGLPRV